MQELIALHQKILALPESIRREEIFDFSKDEAGEQIERLPEELRAELETLRQRINVALPEDFDYFAFFGSEEEEPSFDLHHERMPAGGSHDGTLTAERPLLEQLREVDWQAQREKAAKTRQTMDGVLYLMDMVSKRLRPAKAAQKEFREAMKEFVKEKRADAGRIHLLYWDDEKEMMEADFADGAALREALPGLVAREAEVIAIVAWGKPLPAERIDALKAEAQNVLRERVAAEMRAAEEEDARAEQEAAQASGAGEASGPIIDI